jgi:hypothetical protein
MTKSATDLMQDVLFAAVIDSIVALKAASKGLPNNLLRDLNAIHANTTFADLPPELQGAINASVRAGFNRLLKEGYSVSTAQGDARRGPPPRRDTSGPPPHGPRGGRRDDRPRGKPSGRPGRPSNGKPGRPGPKPPRP